MLFRNAPTPYHASLPLMIGIALALGGLWAFAITKAVQIRRSPVTVGPQTIIGSVGQARANGLVFVNGELWQARTREGERLAPGGKVRVEAVDGLMLVVTPTDETASVT